VVPANLSKVPILFVRAGGRKAKSGTLFQKNKTKQKTRQNKEQRPVCHGFVRGKNRVNPIIKKQKRGMCGGNNNPRRMGLVLGEKWLPNTKGTWEGTNPASRIVVWFKNGETRDGKSPSTREIFRLPQKEKKYLLSREAS